MKDEIKEILEKLKETADTSFFAICSSKEELEQMPKSVSKFLSLNDKQAKLLLDYITNLQEEIERQSKAQVILDNQITEMYDYKSRNEKAIEYNKEKLNDIKEEITTLTITDKEYYNYVKNILNKELNILNGGDDNE